MNPKLQNGFDSMEQKRRALFAQMEKLSPQERNLSPREGKWSAMEIMKHLVESEGLSQAYIQKKLKYRTRIPKTGLVHALRTRFGLMYMRGSIKMKAPSYLGKMSEPIDLPMLQEKWDHSRAELKEILEDFPEELMQNAVLKHPLGGRINILQTMQFLEAHFDRHNKQISKLLTDGTPNDPS
ncbi:MAG: DinB family protein [Bacteroidota bacterium]